MRVGSCARCMRSCTKPRQVVPQNHSEHARVLHNIDSCILQLCIASTDLVVCDSKQSLLLIKQRTHLLNMLFMLFVKWIVGSRR